MSSASQNLHNSTFELGDNIYVIKYRICYMCGFCGDSSFSCLSAQKSVIMGRSPKHKRPRGRATDSERSEKGEVTMTTTKKNIANANANNNPLPMYSFDFKSKELARLTVTIAQAEAAGAKMKLVVCNALANVNALGVDVLNESGFKTIADYGRNQFGYSKSNVYDMLKVADKFGITEDGNITVYPELTGLGWTALLALSKTDDATISKLIGDGKLTPSTSVRAVKALVAPKKPAQATKATMAPKSDENAPKSAGKAPKRADKTPQSIKNANNGTENPDITTFGKNTFTTAFDGRTLIISVVLNDGSKTLYPYNMENSTEASEAFRAFKSLTGAQCTCKR